MDPSLCTGSLGRNEPQASNPYTGAIPATKCLLGKHLDLHRAGCGVGSKACL
jgi:hypothetical protein